MVKTEGASVVEPPQATEAPSLPAVPGSSSEADFGADSPEEPVKTEAAEPAGVAEPPVSSTAEPERPTAEGDRRKRRSHRRSSEDRDDPREARERRAVKREEQLLRSPSVRDARPKDDQNRGRARDRNRPGSRKGSKGS